MGLSHKEKSFSNYILQMIYSYIREIFTLFFFYPALTILMMKPVYIQHFEFMTSVYYTLV